MPARVEGMVNLCVVSSLSMYAFDSKLYYLPVNLKFCLHQSPLHPHHTYRCYRTMGRYLLLHRLSSESFRSCTWQGQTGCRSWGKWVRPSVHLYLLLPENCFRRITRHTYYLPGKLLANDTQGFADQAHQAPRH